VREVEVAVQKSNDEKRYFWNVFYVNVVTGKDMATEQYNGL